jgi:O-antigen/teichoic acid export membrane protein
MSSSPIKKLAGQTIIYGLSSIVPRFLNYLLVPIHTRVFFPEQYGVVTELYTYVTFLIIVLTVGMETGFFRFFNSEDNPKKVYGTAFNTILFISAVFIFLGLFFNRDISSSLDYSGSPIYVKCFVLILGIDAICAIPFAKLRAENKALRFALFKLVNVSVNIILNIALLVVIPIFFKSALQVEWLYPGGKIDVLIIFYANLISSGVTLLLLVPGIVKDGTSFDPSLFKRLILYSLPLMIAGFAGNVNEAIDRVLLKHLLKEPFHAMHELGIYGANIKIAVLMTLFIQMFRFAAEPFFFSQFKEKDSREMFALVTKIFFFFGLFIVLGITGFLNIIRYFIDPAYHEGLKIVPVLLFANLLLGMVFNFSIWYKLNNKTSYGALITIFGALITIFMNILFVPKYSYMAAAWAHLVSYLCMVIITYMLGQKYYPIPYEIRKMFIYLVLAIFVVFFMLFINQFYSLIGLCANGVLLILYVIFVSRKENLLNIVMK